MDDRAETPATEAKQLRSFGIAEIMKLLPHRYPFLLIDKIIEVDGDNSGIGIKNITFNEPYFQGHFPEEPIFPGVLIIEGMAQTAGAMAIAAQLEPGKHLVYLLTVDKCKFRKPVGPGTVLEYHIRKLRIRKGMGWFEARAMADGQLIAEAEIGAMVALDSK
jgi:3-hydroxyacyl-[acyl-carrier-protein] dehydratase